MGRKSLLSKFILTFRTVIHFLNFRFDQNDTNLIPPANGWDSAQYYVVRTRSRQHTPIVSRPGSSFDIAPESPYFEGRQMRILNLHKFIIFLICILTTFI